MHDVQVFDKLGRKFGMGITHVPIHVAVWHGSAEHAARAFLRSFAEEMRDLASEGEWDAIDRIMAILREERASGSPLYAACRTALYAAVAPVLTRRLPRR